MQPIHPRIAWGERQAWIMTMRSEIPLRSPSTKKNKEWKLAISPAHDVDPAASAGGLCMWIIAAKRKIENKNKKQHFFKKCFCINFVAEG